MQVKLVAPSGSWEKRVLLLDQLDYGAQDQLRTKSRRERIRQSKR